MPISHINYRNGPSVSFGTYVHWSLKYQRFYHQIAKILGFLNFLFVCDKNPIFCEIFCNSLLQTKFFSNSVPEKNWEESRLVVSHFFCICVAWDNRGFELKKCNASLTYTECILNFGKLRSTFSIRNKRPRLHVLRHLESAAILSN